MVGIECVRVGAGIGQSRDRTDGALPERSGRAVLVPTLFHTGFNLVATVYLMAGMDPAVAAAIGGVAALIWIFDRKPAGRGEKAEKA